jgi:hypothetical protein
MTIKKFRRIVRYFISKHQEDIVYETVEKGIKYCKSKRPPTLKLMSREELNEIYPAHRNKLRDIIRKYINIDSEAMIKTLFRIVSNNYTSDKAMYAYAEAVMKFVNEPTIKNIAGLDPLSYDGDKKIYLLYLAKMNKEDIDASDITYFVVKNLIFLTNRFNLMKILDRELHNSGKELLKTGLDKKRDMEQIKNIDKYMMGDLIDIGRIIDLIVGLKLNLPASNADELNRSAYKSLIEECSSKYKDKEMVASLINYSLELMPEKFKKLLIGDIEWFLDVSIDGLSSDLHTIIEVTKIEYDTIEDKVCNINDYIDNEIDKAIATNIKK